MPLKVQIASQPDDTSCGPTCLSAIYRFHGVEHDLTELIAEVPAFAEGGTLAVHLGCHALKQGLPVSLFSYNLQVFDPSWFSLGREELAGKLRLRLQKHPGGRKGQAALQAYHKYLELGGNIEFGDLTPTLLRRRLSCGLPILAGLSATWLYQSQREIPETCKDDDITGDPVGHFVVLAGYDPSTKRVNLADPYPKNPVAAHYYSVDLSRLTTAILLGVLTYDANLLIIHPRQ